MIYYVYILRTSRNTLYIGQTNNLERRLKEHKSKTRRSARYVRCFESADLVYSEEQPTRGEAMRRERELRTWTKEKKEKLIVQRNLDCHVGVPPRNDEDGVVI